MEFDDNVIAIIRKQDRTVSAANQSFFDSLPATEQRVFAALSKHVQKFSSDGERFVFDDGNVLLTNQVERIILDAIQGSTYPKDVNGFLRNFETLKQFNFDIHRDVNDLSPDKLGELINPIQRATVEQTLQSLTGSGVSSNFIEPVRTGIFQNIVAGSTKADLEAYLRRFILGTPDVDGTLSRYVKQVSRDALNQFDGQVNAKIANEFGLDAYRYVGSLIEDSRPQCRRWVSMGVIQTKDLPAEIAWMNANGTGAIPGTSPETFSIYRGGYNCRHSAIPFKLTKSQREKLNLPEEEQKIENQFQPDSNLNDAIKRAKQNGFEVYHEGDDLIDKIAKTEIIGENFGLTDKEKRDNIKKLFKDGEIVEFDNETKLKVVNSANEFLFNNPGKKPIDLVIYDEKNQTNVALFEPNTNSIVYNNKKNLRDFEREKTESIDATNIGFAVDKYENKYLGVFSHEYGHFYDLSVQPQSERISRNINSWGNNEKFFKENYKKIDSLISLYASEGTRATEFAAELWATKWNPKFEQLPKETKDFIDEVLNTFGSYNEESLKNWKKLKM
jgi:hypothetical protein